MKRLFGTDGIRGVANKTPMTSEMALALGRAAAYIFKEGSYNKEGKRSSSHRHRIVIGKDTRLSGYMLESALTSGICSMGVDVILVGPLPTPGIAFITRSLRADAGVVISASHNPYEDNGIKFFSMNGIKLPDELEKKMEELIFSNALEHIRPTAREVGKAFRVDDAVGRYIEFVKGSFPRGMTLDGMKIVVDSANGASYRVTPWVLRELGAEVISLNDKPDGTNINLNCGSLYPQIIQKAVIENNADIGVAHDGDADRVILSDESGRVVDGDRIMAVCALDMLTEGRLNKNAIVTTVMSNMGLDISMKKAGIDVIRTDVGDRYVAEKMLEGGYNLGGEQSGHIIFMDYNTTGDGIITALQVLSLMRKRQKKLGEIVSSINMFPQILVNVKVKNKKEVHTNPFIRTAIADAEKLLNGLGRIFVRPSGTEQQVRIMVEGRNRARIKKIAENVAMVIKRELC
ncbi:MAG: phosphoglucosamine mutase [Nitrospirota bacterium]